MKKLALVPSTSLSTTCWGSVKLGNTHVRTGFRTFRLVVNPAEELAQDLSGLLRFGSLSDLEVRQKYYLLYWQDRLKLAMK